MRLYLDLIPKPARTALCLDPILSIPFFADENRLMRDR